MALDDVMSRLHWIYECLQESASLDTLQANIVSACELYKSGDWRGDASRRLEIVNMAGSIRKDAEILELSTGGPSPILQELVVVARNLQDNILETPVSEAASNQVVRTSRDLPPTPLPQLSSTVVFPNAKSPPLLCTDEESPLFCTDEESPLFCTDDETPYRTPTPTLQLPETVMLPSARSPPLFRTDEETPYRAPTPPLQLPETVVFPNVKSTPQSRTGEQTPYQDTQLRECATQGCTVPAPPRTAYGKYCPACYAQRKARSAKEKAEDQKIGASIKLLATIHSIYQGCANSAARNQGLTQPTDNSKSKGKEVVIVDLTDTTGSENVKIKTEEPDQDMEGRGAFPSGNQQVLRGPGQSSSRGEPLESEANGLQEMPNPRKRKRDWQGNGSNREAHRDNTGRQASSNANSAPGGVGLKPGAKDKAPSKVRKEPQLEMETVQPGSDSDDLPARASPESGEVSTCRLVDCHRPVSKDYTPWCSPVCYVRGDPSPRTCIKPSCQSLAPPKTRNGLLCKNCHLDKKVMEKRQRRALKVAAKTGRLHQEPVRKMNARVVRKLITQPSRTALELEQDRRISLETPELFILNGEWPRRIRQHIQSITTSQQAFTFDVDWSTKAITVLDGFANAFDKLPLQRSRAVILLDFTKQEGSFKTHVGSEDGSDPLQGSDAAAGNEVCSWQPDVRTSLFLITFSVDWQNFRVRFFEDTRGSQAHVDTAWSLSLHFDTQRLHAAPLN